MEVPNLVARSDSRNLASIAILDKSPLSFVSETKLPHGSQERFYCLHAR